MSYFCGASEYIEAFTFYSMLKKIVLVLATLFSVQSFSQVLYSERFNALSLNTVTYTANSTTQTFLYKDVPAAMYTINNGNLIADTLTGNYPFKVNGQKQKAWLAYKPANVADTFAVSTSWLNPQATADAWLITPTISNIAANTVLTWEALAPDVDNLDGYEVYVTSISSPTPAISDFTSGSLVFSTSAENASWTQRGISLASFAGQTIRIAFRNNAQNKYQLWLDDIIVKNVSSSFDMEAVSFDTYKYSTINTNNTILASFKNNGSTAVTSLVLNYRMDNGTVISENQTLTNPLNYLGTQQFVFSTLYISSSAAYNVAKVWVSSINGQTDQLHANDTVTGNLTLSTAIPIKNVLVEEFTSAKCGSCPDGYTQLSTIVSTNTNVIAAAVHSNDNLTNAEGTTLTTNFTDEFPSAVIDRYKYTSAGAAIDKHSWSTIITQRQAMKVPVSVSVTAVSYNSSTREISATVQAAFVGDVKGDYRLNLYVKENNVYGPIMDHSDNAWNQYNNLYNVPASPYFQVGTYLSGNTYILGPNQYSHKYVINEFMDGEDGIAGIIPANGTTSGQTYSRVYTYTVPVAAAGEFRYNADNLYLIGVVSENAGYASTILNSAEVKLTANGEMPVGLKETASVIKTEVNVYPNPASGAFYLNYVSDQSQWVKIELYNALGVMVYTRTELVNQGDVTQQLDCSAFAEGNYHIVVSLKDYSVNKKLIIIK